VLCRRTSRHVPCIKSSTARSALLLKGDGEGVLGARVFISSVPALYLNNQLLSISSSSNIFPLALYPSSIILYLTIVENPLLSITMKYNGAVYIALAVSIVSIYATPL
jgi:hypothetical protein